MSRVIHIGDADGLIAMINTKDAHHERVKAIIQKVTERGEQIIFPSTAITEAITTLQIRLANPKQAGMVAEQVARAALPIIPVDAEILSIAVKFYNPQGSKKNTFFDATVAATATKSGTKTIFSFDGWYKSQGFNLLGDIL
jgi:predicted nucleic acid-binding protein